MSTLIIGSILLLFLIFVYPMLDIKYTKPLKEKKDSRSRLNYYKFVIGSEWFVVLIIMAFVFLSQSLDLQNIGFSIPENTEKFSGMIVGFLLGVGFLVFVLMRLPFYKKRLEKQVEGIDYLLPTTKLERKWYIFVAITAGICEEIIYRGFVIHYLSSLPVELEKIHLLILSAVIFGFAHIYQGWKGFILTGLLGFVFARIYLETGSLLFPIILHIVIDMRSFLFTKKLEEDNTPPLNTNM